MTFKLIFTNSFVFQLLFSRWCVSSEFKNTIRQLTVMGVKIVVTILLTVSCLDISTMSNLASTRIDPIKPNLSLMPEVDTSAFVAPVMTDSLSLLC